MSMKWKSKILLAKIEAAYGTDPVPTGLANAILATDIRLTPMEGTDESRNLELPYLGAQRTIPTGLHAKLAFKVELKPSGTAGTAPAWGVLMRGCACAEVISAGASVTYNPVSDGHESVCFYLWIASTLYKLVGSRGNCMLRITAQGIPYLEFEFTGLFVQPAETVRVTPTLASQLALKPEVGSSVNTPTFTVNTVPLVLRSFMLNLGNAVQTRFLIRSESVIIPDKAETIEMTVEAVPLTTLNPFALAAAQTAGALQLVHGVGAGKIATLGIPQAQMQRPQALENQQDIKEWPLRAVTVPVAGNDQWTLALT